jgi:diaminopimelate epimerase
MKHRQSDGKLKDFSSYNCAVALKSTIGRVWKPESQHKGIMSALVNHTAFKMNGLGNEIVVLDLRGHEHVVTPVEARALGKSPGLHFDQMMVLHDPRTPDTAAYVLIYNIDGSEAGACGNGTRCVAWYLAREGQQNVTIETRAGLLDCKQINALNYSVDMGMPRLGWQDIPLRDATDDTGFVPLNTEPLHANLPITFSAVSMGNPHAVFFVEDVEAHELARTGPMLETHAIFPEKANISLASVTARNALTLKVWERGAGLTRACGSGACAAVVSAHRLGLTDRDVRVSLPGGDLMIHWRADNHVIMAGPVEFEYEKQLTATVFLAAV